MKLFTIAELAILLVLISNAHSLTTRSPVQPTSNDLTSLNRLIKVTEPYNRLLGWEGRFFTQQAEVEKFCKNRGNYQNELDKIVDDRYGDGKWMVRWMNHQHKNKVELICGNETSKVKHVDYTSKLMNNYQSIVRSIVLETLDSLIEGLSLVKEGWHLKLHTLWCCTYMKSMNKISDRITDQAVRDYYKFLFMLYSSGGVDLTCTVFGVSETECGLVNSTGALQARKVTKNNQLTIYKSRTESYAVVGSEMLGQVGLQAVLKGLVFSLPESTFSRLSSSVARIPLLSKLTKDNNNGKISVTATTTTAGTIDIADTLQNDNLKLSGLVQLVR